MNQQNVYRISSGNNGFVLAMKDTSLTVNAAGARLRQYGLCVPFSTAAGLLLRA